MVFIALFSCVVLSAVAVLFSLISFNTANKASITVKGLENSTHTVQYKPVEFDLPPDREQYKDAEAELARAERDFYTDGAIYEGEEVDKQ